LIPIAAFVSALRHRDPQTRLRAAATTLLAIGVGNELAGQQARPMPHLLLSRPCSGETHR